MSGFSTSFQLHQAVVVLKDENGEEVFSRTQSLDRTIPVIPGYKRSVDLGSIPLGDLSALYEHEAVYKEVLQGKKYTLIITITGTKVGSTEAKVEFK